MHFNGPTCTFNFQCLILKATRMSPRGIKSLRQISRCCFRPSPLPAIKLFESELDTVKLYETLKKIIFSEKK